MTKTLALLPSKKRSSYRKPTDVTKAHETAVDMEVVNILPGHSKLGDDKVLVSPWREIQRSRTLGTKADCLGLSRPGRPVTAGEPDGPAALYSPFFPFCYSQVPQKELLGASSNFVFLVPQEERISPEAEP